MAEEIDTTNKFLVSRKGNDIVFRRTVPPRISRIDAVNLAAWIVAMCPRENFTAILDAIQNT